MGLLFFYGKFDRKIHNEEVNLSLDNVTAKTLVRVKDYLFEQVIKIISFHFRTLIHVCMTTVNTDS